MAWVFKLVSGTNTLNLSSGAAGTEGYKIADTTIDAPANSDVMTLNITFYTTGTGQVETVRRLEAAISQYLAWAAAYERRERTDPVELWVIPNDGVGVEPKYGAVSRRRLILGGTLTPPYRGRGATYAQTTIPGYTLTLRCRPFWHGQTQWMLCGTGGIIEDTTNGGLYLSPTVNNLCDVPYTSASWLTTNSGASILTAASFRAYGDPYYSVHNKYIRMTSTASTIGTIYRTTEVASPTSAASYTLSAMIKGTGRGIGTTACIAMWEVGGATACAQHSGTVTLTSAWQSASVAAVIAAANRDSLRIEVSTNPGASGVSALIDGVQLTNTGYKQVYSDGDMGLGCRWATSANAGSSNRQAGVLYGNAYSGGVNPAAFAVSLWVTGLDWDSGRSHYLFACGDGTSNTIRIYKHTDNSLYFAVIDGTGATSTLCVSTSSYSDSSWYHIVAVGTYNDMRLYVNGTEANSTATLRDEYNDERAAGAVNGTYATDGTSLRTVTDTESMLTISGLAMPSTTLPAFYLGSDASGANQCECTIHNDLRIYDEALTAAQVAGLYAAGRGPGCLPYAATLAAGATTDPPTVKVYNYESACPSCQNWVQLGNVGGDADAALRWWTTTYNSATGDSNTVGALYYGLSRQDATRQAFSLAPYSLSTTTLDSDTAASADSTATYGYKYHITPSDATWDAVRVQATLPQTLKGRYHAYMRVYDNAATTGIWHVRIEFDRIFSPNVYYPSSSGGVAPAVGKWVLLDLEEVEFPLATGIDFGKGNNPFTLYIWAKRDSGTTALDIDCLFLVPVDVASGRLGDPATAVYSRATFHMDNIDYDPHVANDYQATLYPDENYNYPIGKWYGTFVTLEPQTPQRLVLLSTSAASTYLHSISSSLQMDFAAQVEPHYSSPW